MSAPDKVAELAARLLGTCDHATDEIGELTEAECYRLDQLVFCCEECNWWFEGCTQANDDSGWFCVECRPDEADE